MRHRNMKRTPSAAQAINAEPFAKSTVSPGFRIALAIACALAVATPQLLRGGGDVSAVPMRGLVTVAAAFLAFRHAKALLMIFVSCLPARFFLAAVAGVLIR